jgi:hypothetical protein
MRWLAVAMVAGCGAGCPDPVDGGTDPGAVLDAVAPGMMVALDFAAMDLAERAAAADVPAACVALAVGSAAAGTVRDLVGQVVLGTPGLPGISVPVSGCGEVDVATAPPASVVAERAFGVVAALHRAYRDRLPCEASAWIEVGISWGADAVSAAIVAVQAIGTGTIPAVSVASQNSGDAPNWKGQSKKCCSGAERAATAPSRSSSSVPMPIMLVVVSCPARRIIAPISANSSRLSRPGST